MIGFELYDAFFFSERRPIHGFMKVYEPTGTKHCEEEEENEEAVDDYDFRHVAKDSHIPNHNTVSVNLFHLRVHIGIFTPGF